MNGAARSNPRSTPGSSPTSAGASTGAIEPALRDWLGADPAAQRKGEPGWLGKLRAAAAERAAGQNVPTQKSENWRYTALRGLIDQGFKPQLEPISALQAEDLEDQIVAGLDSYRLVMVNGRFEPRLSQLEDLPEGVRVGGLADVIAQDPDAIEGLLGRVAGEGQHLFTSLNTAAFDDGLVMLIDAGVQLERPVELLHLSIGLDQPSVAQPRHLISLAEGARADLVERYLSFGEAIYCNNAVVEIRLAKDARLHHDRLQQESPSAYHLTGLYLEQDADSRYRGINIGMGGAWARTDLVTRFLAPGGDCELQGLYLAGDRQLIDYHMDVQHQVPGCSSRENFKGILHGKGKAVFDGRVYVAVGAQQTDAAMSNRNLILSPNAEVDTKPQLEIYADDVKCSHGTTVGQLEPEMLFYLRSRGIAAPLARRMLCLGFAGEIIDAIGSDSLRETITESVGQRLEQSPL
ncbi:MULTISPECIES: Fe-S cluster assembly protein SufD [Thiorhodovibrio]|uniref:Fe-S cluster assembly protein SufD n=1 Tax=Thiorhodovibrio TaxID=61593 RepID=UPI0019126079|nr:MULTISPECIES: Fe-S cluster assembly protein SufD [Thiorhodovibrio]MBK5969249.1 Fe-S cluster assembly protein SufD [Thiorhodovibrio winogradskyi]WPL11240.1 FeS cluster assembly protein SufD [Thiorhodovibrio litoralis]